MSAHSPGPWTRDLRGSAQEIVAADRTIIAVVYGGEDEECIANGVLVQSAPDLLAMLDRLVNCRPDLIVRMGLQREAEKLIRRIKGEP